jgi:hypothetical protein
MPTAPGPEGGVLSKPLVLLAGLVLAGSLTVIAAASLTPWTDVPYPDGYRRWVHVSSALAQGTGQPVARIFAGRDDLDPHACLCITECFIGPGEGQNITTSQKLVFESIQSLLSK